MKLVSYASVYSFFLNNKNLLYLPLSLIILTRFSTYDGLPPVGKLSQAESDSHHVWGHASWGSLDLIE